MSKISIIPKPAFVEVGDSTYTLSAETAIVANEETHALAELVASLLRPATGFEFPIVGISENAIRLTLDDGEESASYQLTVAESGVNITSTSVEGLFYGVQSVRQLLPEHIESNEPVDNINWSIPFVVIKDEPRFAWRGLHLDVSRHFFGVDFIKKFIDLMALYKFNIFHWHLTEDQGWRIEIKQYPKLTEIGSKRKETPIPENPQRGDGKPYGGYYTQDEIREVVAYATERAITIVPEIEMPGHALAALASYPELGCVGESYEVSTTWGIFSDVFCAGKDSVFTFLENVLTEVLDLFPSKFIHIGGDECPKERWEVCPNCQARIEAEGLKDEHELQSYFIRRIEKWLNEKGRRLVGWDEILEGGLAPNATVMSWRGSQGGIDAANAGHDVVMSPNTTCYLDYYQSENTEAEPAAIGGYISLEKAYLFEPIPADIVPEKAHHIIGGQGNVWTEYMPTKEQVEYMTYPRSIALAEILWTYPDEPNFAEFSTRLGNHLPRLSRLNLNYRIPQDDD